MGYSRDTNEIINLNFPVFSAGTYAQDQASRGKVVDYRVPIQCGQVTVEPGDILFGDRDGVVVVPQSIEKDILAQAIEKARGEKKVQEALRAGMGAVEAYQKFGIM